METCQSCKLWMIQKSYDFITRVLLVPTSHVQTCTEVKLNSHLVTNRAAVSTCTFRYLFLCCRYLTVLYYLNDVVRGGETAFPVADEKDFNQTVMFPCGLFREGIYFPMEYCVLLPIFQRWSKVEHLRFLVVNLTFQLFLVYFV